jgi:hypothetical protein
VATVKHVHVTDPRALRAMAHPLRTDIYYELYSRGSARAADLSVALGVPANQVSFHLRTLAKYGFIEEAPEEARDRRDRVWRPASEEGLAWSSRDFEGKPGGEAAVRVLRRHGAAWMHEMIDAFFTEPGPEDKGTVRTSNDVPMQLTKAEAERAASEVYAVLKRWSDRGREAVRAGDTEGRTMYIGLMTVQPYPERLRKRRAG